MKPKIMAFYLPQFHRIPENDEWWGEGFTDWVSARNAVPYYKGHYQPRVPLNNNYYNLLDKKTMQWQAKLAKKAGVYGFCIYHYWFGGKCLLEKPAENLLKWKDIDINYCFSWANLGWIRSWSKYNRHRKCGAWLAETAEGKNDQDNGVLIWQDYGNREVWKRHFDYLLPFFHDTRYIKKDNMPIFVIHTVKDIKPIRPMITVWNQLAKENGFAGIYFVGTNCDDWKNKNLNASIRYEPFYTMEFDRKYILMRKKWEKIIGKYRGDLQFLRYSNIWKSILKRKNERNVWQGGFIDLDTTPRMGKTGNICVGATPNRFYLYLAGLYRKAKKNKQDYIFLTAWNEWGEGAYLEPDQKNGFAYLRMIKRVVDGDA